MRRTTSRREKQQPNETGGFRFAVTLLAALGTIVYAIYIYLQNTPVDPDLYGKVCILIAVALILVVGLLFYILIEGYSMEVQNSKYLKKLASRIYQGVFVLFIMLLGLFLSSFVMTYLILKIENTQYGGFDDLVTLLEVVPIFIAISIGVFLARHRLLKSSNPKRDLLIIMYSFTGVFISCILIYSAVVSSPLQGHVTVNMESIYYKNDAPIPVLIHVTGPNPDLSIDLLEEKSNHNLSRIDNITLKPERNLSNPSKPVYGENSTLVGNALNYGTYNVFINTTNLSAGYFELVCTRHGGYNKTYVGGARGFYLLNSSQQSCIKE